MVLFGGSIVNTVSTVGAYFLGLFTHSVSKDTVAFGKINAGLY